MFRFLACCLAISVLGAADASAPMVMLKLDDLHRWSKDPQAPAPEKWRRMAAIVEAEGAKANLGIFAESLEGDCPVYVRWIQERVASGRFEIWHHGYYNRFPADPQVAKQSEYQQRPAADQADSMRKAVDLVRAKTGLVMRAFGPHGTPLDGVETYAALAGIPEIEVVWFYGPAKGVVTDKVVIERRAELEKPIFKPNAGNLKQSWEKLRTRDYLALQGHPGSWDEQGFAEFAEAVRFLAAQGCRFVTVSEWLRSRG